MMGVNQDPCKAQSFRLQTATLWPLEAYKINIKNYTKIP